MVRWDGIVTYVRPVILRVRVLQLMKTIPNFATMLPSKVKAEVVKFYYDQLVSAKLNRHADPMYKDNDAVGDCGLFNNEYAESMWYECFAIATRDYEKDYRKDVDYSESSSVGNVFRHTPSGGRIYPFDKR